MMIRHVHRALPICLALCLPGLPPAEASATRTAYEKYLFTADDEKYQLAFALINQLVKTSLPSDDLYAERARMRLELNQPAAAIKDLNRALELNPKNAEAYRRRAYCYLVTRQYKKGIRDLDRSIKLVGCDSVNLIPTNDYTNRARAYNILKKPALATKDARKARQCKLLDRAMDMRKQSVSKAIKIASDVIRADPSLVQARMVRGLFNLNLNHFKEAIRDFSTALGVVPNMVPILYFRADAYNESGQYKKAIADYTRIISLKPRLVLFSYTANTGRYRDHFQYKDKNPVNLADIHFLRGMCYMATGNPNLAISDYSATIKMDGMEWEAYYERAGARLLKRQYKAAISDYTNAWRLNPKHWKALIRRSEIHERLGDSQKAIDDLSTIVKANPQDPGIYQLRGELHKKLKRYQDAIRDYSSMIKKAPLDYDAYKCRGDIYAKTGAYKKALRDYNQALKLKSEDKAAIMEAKARVLSKLQQSAK